MPNIVFFLQMYRVVDYKPALSTVSAWSWLIDGSFNVFSTISCHLLPPVDTKCASLLWRSLHLSSLQACLATRTGCRHRFAREWGLLANALCHLWRINAAPHARDPEQNVEHQGTSAWLKSETIMGTRMAKSESRTYECFWSLALPSSKIRGATMQWASAFPNSGHPHLFF